MRLDRQGEEINCTRKTEVNGKKIRNGSSMVGLFDEWTINTHKGNVERKEK